MDPPPLPPTAMGLGSGLGSGSNRAPRPPSIRSARRAGNRAQDGDEASQPPSPMTYFPNPSTFTSSPNPQYIPSIQTSPSLGSARLGSVSQSSISTDGESGGYFARTPRGGGELQAQQQFYLSQSSGAGGTGLHLRYDSTPSGIIASPRLESSRRSASVATGPGHWRPGPITQHSYGSTSQHVPQLGASVDALGLGSSFQAGANADARRIASSATVPNVGPSGRSRVNKESPGLPIVNAAPSGGISLLTTPRHRIKHSDSSSSVSHLVGGTVPRASASSSRATHRRHRSVASTLPTVTQAAHSPSGSAHRRIKRTTSIIGIGRPQTYDADESDYGDYDGEDEGMRANGIRVWYSSYVTIDWLHDAIKESSRIRHLRHGARRSLRGAVRNALDRSQGWVLASIIGFLTAVAAFLIIRTEMMFFDLKEGYCTSSWGKPKRFCCAPREGTGHSDPSSGDEEVCGDWMEWGQLFDSQVDEQAALWTSPEFACYFIVALVLACTASALTYYLSSSATHITSKDSAFLGPEAAPPSPSSASVGKSPSERQPLLEQFETEAEPEQPAAAPPRPVIYMAAGSGIPEIKTILSGFVIHGYLGLSTLVVKSIGLAMSVASGLSLGKEGPFVHIASCIANIISRVFVKYEQNEAKRREVLSAACAAGVSVSFGAPIGGVLFSLEETSYYFPPKVMWRSFWCAAVAAITLKALNPYGNGSIVLFAVTYTKEYHYWEFAVFILLGVFGGLYGAFFSKLNIWWSRHIRKGTWIGRHPIFEVAVVVSLTTVVSFLNPYTRMGGNELVAKMFAECEVGSTSRLCIGKDYNVWPIVHDVGMALLIKAVLTTITFGIVLPAGIFIPSLVVGACFGRIVGVFLESFEFHYPYFPIFEQCPATGCVVPGIYAMVGAAATLAGVTRTTVSLAVILFELTGTLNYVVPVMLAVLIAKTVADAIEKRGIYELVIELKKLPYLSHKDEYLWGSRLVSEVMDRDVPILRADKPHTVRQLTGRLLELVRLGYGDAGFPVLVKEPALESEGNVYAVLRVIGFLGVNELEHALSTLADEPDALVNLIPDDSTPPRSSMMSIFSFRDSADGRHNPYDLGQYIDRAPITVQVYSPLELVQQLFVKLGARQILVTDSRGHYRGALYKKQWIAFLDDLEHIQG